VLLAIGPVGGLLAGVGECGEGGIVGEFDGEVAVCGELEKLTGAGRRGIAAAVVLELPIFFGEVVERVHGEVGVGAVQGGDAVEAVHAEGPECDVGCGEGSEGKSEEG
jgi:hypothetical protein